MIMNLPKSPLSLPAAVRSVRPSEGLLKLIAVYCSLRNFSFKHMMSVFIKTHITLQNLTESTYKQEFSTNLLRMGVLGVCTLGINFQQLLRVSICSFTYHKP